jgi:hypothetical protein
MHGEAAEILRCRTEESIDALHVVGDTFSTLMKFTSQRPINMGRLEADTASTYVAVAVRLAQSLADAGKRRRVFTNDPERLLTLAGAKAGWFTAVLLKIDPVFPLHLRFYAAHHKLQVFEHFSEETWPNCFLDLDIVLSRDAEAVQKILESPRAMEAWVYDISAQVVPAYSRWVVQGDLTRLGAVPLFRYGTEGSSFSASHRSSHACRRSETACCPSTFRFAILHTTLATNLSCRSRSVPSSVSSRWRSRRRTAGSALLVGSNTPCAAARYCAAAPRILAFAGHEVGVEPRSALPNSTAADPMHSSATAADGVARCTWLRAGR